MKSSASEICIKKATREDEFQIISFFNQYLLNDNRAIYNREFLCPVGLKFAIIKGNVVIATKDNDFVGALRYYKRKRENSVSLYQFAIASEHRGQGLLLKMLNILQVNKIIVKCPIGVILNEYFLKTGWKISDSNRHFNIYSKIMNQ